MTERLLSIPGIYLSVLWALFRTTIGIAFWGIVNAIFDLSASETRNVEPISDGGFWWLLYVIAAFALVFVLHSDGAPRWLGYLVIAVAVLGVPPLYWTFHRDAPSDQKRKIGITDVASVMPLPEFAVPTVEVAELLRPDSHDPAGRDARDTRGREGRR